MVVTGTAGRTRVWIALRTFVKLLPWEVAHALIWRLRAMGWGEPPSAASTVLQVALVVDLVVAVACVAVAALGRRPPHDLVVARTRVARRS
jgi:hypothetical protein